MVDVKIKKKPKRRPTAKEIVESANRVNKAERLEEIRAKNKNKRDRLLWKLKRKDEFIIRIKQTSLVNNGSRIPK